MAITLIEISLGLFLPSILFMLANIPFYNKIVKRKLSEKASKIYKNIDIILNILLLLFDAILMISQIRGFLNVGVNNDAMIAMILSNIAVILGMAVLKFFMYPHLYYSIDTKY